MLPLALLALTAVSLTVASLHARKSLRSFRQGYQALRQRSLDAQHQAKTAATPYDRQQALDAWARVLSEWWDFLHR